MPQRRIDQSCAKWAVALDGYCTACPGDGIMLYNGLIGIQSAIMVIITKYQPLPG